MGNTQRDIDICYYLDAFLDVENKTELVWDTTFTVTTSTMTISSLFYGLYHSCSFSIYDSTSVMVWSLLLLVVCVLVVVAQTPLIRMMMNISTNDAAGMLLKRSDKKYMIVDDKDNGVFFTDVSMLNKLGCCCGSLSLYLCDGSGSSISFACSSCC